MSKCYMNEQQLMDLYNRQFFDTTWEDFEEWLESQIDDGNIEIIEFNHYDVTNLDFKPTAKLVGENGNVFNLMAIAKKALVEAGKDEAAEKMCNRILHGAKSYEEALYIIMEYVEVE